MWQLGLVVSVVSTAGFGVGTAIPFFLLMRGLQVGVVFYPKCDVEMWREPRE